MLLERRVKFRSQSTSASRLCGFVVCISFIIAVSPTAASEYAEPGIFEVVKAESEIRVLVYRGGLLGGFGHNHVISTSDVVGRIEIDDDPAASCVELKIAVDQFKVDVEAIRLEEGEPFRKTVSEDDKSSTRKNLLGAKLLDSARFPDITILSQSWSGEFPDILVNSEITVKDQTNAVQFPASVSASVDQIVVTGSFAVTHEQLGLKPFTALLGGLRVRDDIQIKFLITAKRVGD